MMVPPIGDQAGSSFAARARNLLPAWSLGRFFDLPDLSPTRFLR
jgi:hypothetical protein